MIQNIIAFIESLDPLVFYSFVALTSLIILSQSADTLVYGISHYAKKLGVSDYLVGFIVVSIGTALPELVAALNGAVVGQGSIVFGTIFGSNIFKIPLLGLVLLIAKNIKTKSKDIGIAPIITLLIITLPVFLVIDGFLSRKEGVVLIIAFLIYLSRLWQKEGKLGKMKKDIAFKTIYKDGIIFLISLAVLLISGRFLVFSSLSIALILDISPYIVGLLIIGIGASMPELTVQLRSIFRHHESLAFGNVFGSLIANSAFVLGVTAVLHPFPIEINLLWITAIIMTTGVTYVLFLMGKNEVNWKHGLILLSIYAIFLILEWLF